MTSIEKSSAGAGASDSAVGASVEVFKERCNEMHERYLLLQTVYRTSGNDMTYNERLDICAELRNLGQLITTYEAIIYYKMNKDIQKDSLQIFMHKLQRNKMTSDLQSFYFYEWLNNMNDT